jgi:hypothetical protein
MSFSVEIITFSQCADTFIDATVAHIGRLVEAQANLFLKIGAYFITVFAIGTSSVTIRLVLANLTFYAVLAEQAPIRTAAICTFAAVNRTGTYFPRNSGCTPAEFTGNSSQWHSFFQVIFDLISFAVC